MLTNLLYNITIKRLWARRDFVFNLRPNLWLILFEKYQYIDFFEMQILSPYVKVFLRYCRLKFYKTPWKWYQGYFKLIFSFWTPKCWFVKLGNLTLTILADFSPPQKKK